MKHLHTAASFEMTARPPLLVRSDYYKTIDGQLAHYTDDTLRATVPPEGWADYVKAWPDAQVAIDAINAAFQMDNAVNAMIQASREGLQVDEIIIPAGADPQNPIGE